MARKQVVITVPGAGEFSCGHVHEDHYKALPCSKRATSQFAKAGYDVTIRQELASVDGGPYFTPYYDVTAFESIELDQQSARGADDNPNCPDCGAAMVRRTAKKGRRKGREFWGCSKYPRCKGIRDVDDIPTGDSDAPEYTPFPGNSDDKPEAKDVSVTSNKIDQNTAQTILTALGIAPQVDEELLRNVVREEFQKLDLPVRKVFEIPDKVEIDCGDISHPEMETLAQLLGGGARRIWITGEAGTGKTHAVEQIAKALGRNLYIITPVTDKYELYGYKDAHGNYQETQLYRWVTDPSDDAILLFDEIDGCHPSALVSANAALANGMAVFPNGQLEVKASKCVIATANTWGEGPSLKYNARMAQDLALVDRFYQRLHWGLDEQVERQIALKQYGGGADKAVDASRIIRRNLESNGIELQWGPRRTYSMAESHAKCGLSIEKSALLAGLTSLDENQRKLALKGVTK